MKSEFLNGNIVNLRSLEESDLENIFNWLSDHDVTKLLFYRYYPPKIEKMKEEIKTSRFLPRKPRDDRAVKAGMVPYHWNTSRPSAYFSNLSPQQTLRQSYRTCL